MQTDRQSIVKPQRDTGQAKGLPGGFLIPPARHVDRIDWKQWRGPGRFTPEEVFGDLRQGAACKS
jgi:hypothetical protein